MVKYFESGYLTLNATGGTTGGKAVVKLTDISLSYQVDTDETTSFVSNYTKEYEPTYSSWSVSCSGIMDDVTAKSTIPQLSGQTAVQSVLFNGFDLLEQIKTRTKHNLRLRVDTSNWQRGDVIITSFEYSGSVGGKATFSLQLQGTGTLVKSAT